VIKDDIQPAAPAFFPLDEAPPESTPPIPPPDKALAELTPFMRQWTAAKRENPDALLFFRMGDFYELFYDDAVTVSRELQLTLTARDRERSQPMCGVPYHAVEQYLTRLLRKGYRIAICDQMEDPKLTKKIVRREVTRVLTPGTALDAGLGQEQNNFLAALYETGTAKEPVCAVALLDVSTGEFRTAEFTGGNARQLAVDAILMSGASEVLVAASAELPAAWSGFRRGRGWRIGCGRGILGFRWWSGN
jgi:DNA mismatch repair protein MutS